MAGIVCTKRISPVIKRNVGETPQQHIERVYALFLPLIKQVCEKMTFRGKRIEIPDYGEPEKYRAFFNHLFQYDLESGNFNYNRLIDCRLVPLMLLNHCEDGKCQFCLQTICYSGGNKIYLLCKTYKYWVILKENKDSVIICTGYNPTDNQIKKVFKT